MHSYQEALGLVLQHTPAGKPQSLPEPLVARFDSPRFDTAQVDGFAVRAIDTAQTPVTLLVVDRIEAGDSPSCTIRAGEAARIMAGAPFPPGADAVVMQEDCRWTDDQVTVCVSVDRGRFVRRKGEDYRSGEHLLPAGTALTPPVVALLAANGQFRPTLPISVMVLGTGNEFGIQGEPLEDAQVYDSSSYAIEQALHELGLWKVHRWTLRDDSKQTERLVRATLPHQHILISIGGVSLDEQGLVRGVFEGLGVIPYVDKVSMRPGKQFFFGKLDDKLVFGLPSNPVAALVCFFFFVRPAVLKMTGFSPDRDEIRVTTKTAFKGDDRYTFIRGRLQDGVVESLEGQGSHELATLALTNCVIHVPQDSCIGVGDQVTVTKLNW